MCLTCSKPTAEVLTEYTRKVDFLKGLLEAERLVSVVLLKTTVCRLHFLFTMLTLKSEHQQTVFFFIVIYYIRFPLEMLFLTYVSLVLVQSSTTEKALANQFLAPGRTPTIANERMPATKTVHMQTKARCTEEMRDELLGTVG